MCLLTPCTYTYAGGRAAERGNRGGPQARQSNAAPTGKDGRQAVAQVTSNMLPGILPDAAYTRRGRGTWNARKAQNDEDKQVKLLLLPFHPSHFASTMYGIKYGFSLSPFTDATSLQQSLQLTSCKQQLMAAGWYDWYCSGNIAAVELKSVADAYAL